MILFHRDSDGVRDPTPHIIIAAKDMVATVAAIKAAEWNDDHPCPFGNSGAVLGVAIHR